jgi:aminoglycoside phosphotransferase (APT) family kinase protein
VAPLADRLLGILREHLETDALAYALPPRPLGGAAFSEVLELELVHAPDPFAGRLVLRLYPPTADPALPRYECAVGAGLASTDVPVPRVLLADTTPELLGRPFTLVPRLPGRPFLRGVRWDLFARDFPRLLVRWGRTAAGVLARLHACDPSALEAAARAEGLDRALISTRRHLDAIEDRLASVGAEGVIDGVLWLRDREPPRAVRPSIVHGDLWAGNVLFERGALTGVVDWDRVAIGDPALDIGFAKAGLALIPAPFPPPPPIRQAVHGGAVLIARDLHREYARLRPVDDERVAYYEALRCFLELSYVVAWRLRRNPGPDEAAAPPWDNGADELARHFTTVTGVPLRLPPRRA